MTRLISCCINPNNIRGGKYSSPFINYDELFNNNSNEIKNELLNHEPY